MTIRGRSKLRSDNQFGSMALTVPIHLSRALAAAGLARAEFEAELTDEGILFRFVQDLQPSSIDLPAWAQNGKKS